ncbi:hypothetical protein H4R99_002553 [Coemansia sp. RSA 1722]|nr:hypothetical protein H4R99_002553 [Coemansia sp. RSA 1722]
MESKLLSGITHCISNALDLKISSLSSQIDNKLKEISTAIRESSRPNDNSINTRIEELGSSPEKTVAVIPATTVPANANTPLQLLPPPPLPPLPPLQSAPIADQSVLQPVSISDSEFAGTLCIMVWGCVREQRTSCGSAFAIAETMRKVDSQWPFALVDGWPTAIEASSVTSASSLSRKRQKTRR